MKLAVHTTQVDLSGVMQWWVYVRSFPGKSWLRSLRAVCFTIVLYCTAITWQQIFKGLLEVTVVGVLLHVTVERKHFGR